MPSGPQHYQDAERLITARQPTEVDTLCGISMAPSEHDIALAQVHATLALAAATAQPAVDRYCGGHGGNDDRAWTEALA